jgi:hypothetical protein
MQGAMNDFIENLRSFSLFFKLETKPKFRKAVTLDDAIRALKSIEDSYNAFVESEYFKINTENDKTKYNKIKKHLIEENKLLIVDLKFESLGVSIAPDTINTKFQIPNIKDSKKWKKDTYSDFLETVIYPDYEDDNFLNRISKRFNDAQRSSIYRPIIEGIVKNEESKFFYSRPGSDRKLTKISKISQTSIAVLTPASTYYKAKQTSLDEARTSLALVEIKGEKIKPKVLQLFDKIEKPIVDFDKILYDDVTYKLRHKVYCEAEFSQDSVFFQNDDLGIYVTGKNLDDAKIEFSREFDFIYKRYNELNNDVLTPDVIRIKNYLNLIVS